jgi:hypothetical protein
MIYFEKKEPENRSVGGSITPLGTISPLSDCFESRLAASGC